MQSTLELFLRSTGNDAKIGEDDEILTVNQTQHFTEDMSFIKSTTKVLRREKKPLLRRDQNHAPVLYRMIHVFR